VALDGCDPLLGSEVTARNELLLDNAAALADAGAAARVEEWGAKERCSALPDEGSALPDEGPALPDEGPALPDEGPALPDEGPALPDEGPALADGECEAWGRVSTGALNSAAHVPTSISPVGARPARRWNSATAPRVSGPKMPSTAR
jgi:hypothetical protein